MSRFNTRTVCITIAVGISLLIKIGLVLSQTGDRSMGDDAIVAGGNGQPISRVCGSSRHRQL